LRQVGTFAVALKRFKPSGKFVTRQQQAFGIFGQQLGQSFEGHVVANDTRHGGFLWHRANLFSARLEFAPLVPYGHGGGLCLFVLFA
jgi:hypothetical protein